MPKLHFQAAGALPCARGLRRLVGILFTFMALLGWSGAAAAPPGASGDQRWVPGQILVKAKPGLSEARLAQIIERQGGRAVGRIPQIDVRVIRVPEHAVERVAAALARNPAIKFAEPDYLEKPEYTAPNDPRFDTAWHLGRIRAPEAWSVSQGDNIVVAILDTGIHADHPDFAGKLVKGWNAASQNDDISDVHGHGTRVAGTVGAATDNATGVAAVGWDAKIMPIRVTNRSDGVASSSDMARALTWAADHGAHVANMSYESWRHSTVASAAKYMRDKGGLVFGAAGNSGTNAGHTPTPHVIVVAATGSSDTRTSWSNYGDYVDLSAPGASIQTTSGVSSYSSVNGTSFSSPVAAAVAALVMAANPQLTPSQVEKVLFDSAEDLGDPGWDPYYGWGRVDAARAVNAVWSAATDLESPQVRFTQPAQGSTVSGEVLIKVEASDNVGVTRVVVFVDGKELGREAKAPYEFVWDTRLLSDGNVQLRAEAYDEAGNRGTQSIAVTVQQPSAEPEPELAAAPAPEPELADTQPPVITILSPADGETVSGNVRVGAQATDNVGVVRMELFVNGEPLCSNTSDSISCNWHTKRLSGGDYILSAQAEDAAGNLTAEAITVSIGGSSSDDEGGGGGPPPGRGHNK